MRPTFLEVNLDAVAHNLGVFRSHVPATTKVLVMVKSNGYGSGAVPVARFLEKKGADYLGVAYLDEGVALRKAGILMPILVFNPEAKNAAFLYKHQLEPAVYSLARLREIQAFCVKKQVNMNIHLKFDTGMNRLGFKEVDVLALLEALRLGASAEFRPYIASVMTHFSGSDSAQFDAFSALQQSKFEAILVELATEIPATTPRHLGNTGGILRHPEAHGDLVRLGIGLYGIANGPVLMPLQVTNSLFTTISQIHTVETEESVGYNRSGRVTKKSRIATLSIGYGDGYLRLAGNGRHSVLIHGKLAPTVGNICMDLCMVDVTDIPEAQEGDQVEVFGAQNPADKLAKALQTIAYEVFTNISARVPRRYVEK